MKQIDMQSSQPTPVDEQQRLYGDTIATPLQESEKEQLAFSKTITDLLPPILSELDSEKLRDVGEAYQTLAGSLNVWEHYEGKTTAEQQALIDQIIINDAHDLAANILPAETVETLSVPAKRRDDISFEHPPMLKDLFLLIRAYDATQDETLKHSIEYILDELPPSQSELLAEAYERAEAYRETSENDDTSVMGEYRRLGATYDNEMELAHTRQLAVTDHNGFVKHDSNGYIIGQPQTDRHTDPFVDEQLKDYLEKQSTKKPVGGIDY
ncbi:MAG TPA: hypothetical protein VFM68_01420 [Candidatus Saccharimonadales bacterium]|nr:hypothetical protein [Candidatus Saccharimonadales bacterium]